MKRLIIALVFVGLLPMVSISCKTKETAPIENGEVQAFLEEYYQTFSDRNWEAYEAFFTDQAVLTTIWQSEADSVPVLFTNTISQFLEQTESGPDSQPIFEERMINSEITVKKDLGSAWVEYEAKFGTEDSLMEWKGHDLFSLIQHEDRWYIASLSYVSE